MNKKTTIISSVSLLAFLVTGMTANAQFTETMGTTGPSSETIAAREAAGRFSVANLTYSGTADVRTTVPSTGYTGASGGYNTLIQAQETFEAHTIDASACTAADSLTFGVFKSTNASTGIDYLVLEYSVNNGSSWTSIPFTALPTGTGTSKWYRRAVALPAAAHSATLWVRFRNSLVGTSSSNPQFRIDDFTMTCGATVDCSGLTASVEVAGDAVFCEGNGSVDLIVTTNVTSPVYQWYNQNDSTPVAGETSDFFTATASGTYYVKITNADGCVLNSAGTRVLAYPAPELCVEAIAGCEGTTVEFCPALRTSDLIISEYVEGSSFNKYLELYNGTCETLDMGDYKLFLYTNGSPVAAGLDIISLPAGDLVAPGATYVIAHTNADSAHLADFVTLNLDFNGDDAIELYNDAASFTADIFGSIGFDPGSNWRDTVSASPTLGWTTENKTLVRKSCVYSGITVNPVLPGIYGFSTLFTEWDTLSVNDISGLGSHMFTGAPYAFSIGSGTATITSSTASCANVRIGDGVSTLLVTPTLCGFNNCGPVTVTVTEECGQARSISAPAQGSLKLQAFPNPTADATTLVFEQAQDGEVMITLADLSGHVVLAQTVVANAGEQRIELNMAQLAAGTYVCSIASGNGFETVRIVRSK